MLKLIMASIVATLAAGGCALLVMAMYPVQVTNPNPATPEALNKSYTLEKLNDHQKQVEKKAAERFRELEQETLLERVAMISNQGIVVSWLPWLIAGVLLRVRKVYEAALLLAIPVALAAIGILSFLGLGAYAVAFGMGQALRLALTRRPT